MYALFTLFAGAAQSAMMTLNGMLSDYIGLFAMSMFVHLIGGILLIFYMKAKKERIHIGGVPWYLYSAGVFGVLLVVTSSFCYGVLGVSLTTCLSISGQVLMSAVIDHFGWFGMPKSPFQLKRLPCFALMLAGLIIVILA